MARPASRYPTALELEILKILWRGRPRSGREVRDALAPYRDLAYTSVMTMMKIMARKRFLRRKKTGGGYVYYPCVTEAEVTRGMLGDLVDRVFDGSAVAVMLNLLENSEIDQDELKELRKLIGRKAREEQK
jgi:BlaI family transcriptional regulator, penicillinase repressor